MKNIDVSIISQPYILASNSYSAWIYILVNLCNRRSQLFQNAMNSIRNIGWNLARILSASSFQYQLEIFLRFLIKTLNALRIQGVVGWLIRIILSHCQVQGLLEFKHWIVIGQNIIYIADLLYNSCPINMTSFIELRQPAFDQRYIRLLITKVKTKAEVRELKNSIILMVGLHIIISIGIAMSMYLTFSRCSTVSIYVANFCNCRNLVSDYPNTSPYKYFEQFIIGGIFSKQESKRAERNSLVIQQAG